MMLDILIWLLITAMYICGLKKATQKGMLLHKVDDVLCNHLPDWIYKPILGCLQCMASVHGIISLTVYFVINHFELKFVIIGIIYIPALSYLTKLLWFVFGLIWEAELNVSNKNMTDGNT